ncbi:CvpA family protein [Acinetobacter sp. ANC 4648]|uniref:CvpA family protein n=1 Tax=Acinetobacter sp. ANC 4648 TaxID=1977875 RepID=UPI000A34F61D|nr:CvpA family protein [Acinetobacter sp. ANC 4648]OTG83093.1 colicin V synthesis protein [Acinetobacter sp. ANC 4648]
MNTIDIILLIILLIGGLNGLRQGFVKAFANFVGWIFALIVGAKYANIVAPSMSSLSHDPVVQKIAAFAFIVLIIIVLTWIVTAFLNSILKTLKLGPLNRLAGGAFGSLKGLMIVLITMQGLSPWVGSSPLWKQSKFIHVLLPWAPLATEISKDAANHALSEMKSEDHIESKRVDTETDSKNKEQSSHSTKNPFY